MTVLLDVLLAAALILMLALAVGAFVLAAREARR